MTSRNKDFSSLSLHERGFVLPLTRFVGRRKEAAEIKRALKTRRLVSLSGPSGCGKTRLAHQVAVDLFKAGQDVWWTGLVGVTDGQLVASAVVKTLGVRDKPGQSPTEALVDALGRRKTLLVLDNCDDVEGAVARLAEELMAACPDVRLLVTGQGPLEVAGETIWRVDPLDVPPVNEPCPLAELSRYAAVELFVARAQDSDPAFTLTGQNAPVVTQICQAVDGIPLALELAAARVRVLSLGEIAERLSDRFRFLRDRNRSGEARHQTLEAAIDWSYRLLTESEQTLLRRLSGFVGGFTLASAEAICADSESGQTVRRVAGDELLDLLDRLSKKALLSVEGRESGQVRYRMLETIRHYGQRKLDDPVNQAEAAEVRRRHVEYFTVLAVEAEPHLAAADQADWLARLDGEHDNVLAAIGLCPPDDRSDRRGLRLLAALWPYWRLRGFIVRGRALMAPFLAPYLAANGDHLDPDPILAHALLGAGQLAYTQGAYAEARDYLEASLALVRAAGDKVEEAIALNNLGNIAWMCGDYSEASAYHQQALALRRMAGDGHGIAMSLDNLGMTTCYQGDPTTARALLEESLALRTAAANTPGMVNALNGLGEVARSEGNVGEAVRCYTQSIELARAIADPVGPSWPLHNLGLVYLSQGKLKQASDYLGQSLHLFDPLDDRIGVVTCLGGIGGLAVQAGHAERGTRLLAASETQLQALGAFLAPTDHQVFRHHVNYARSSLDPLVFVTAWAVGSTMTYQQALREAEAVLRTPMRRTVAPVSAFRPGAQAQIELDLHALGAVRVSRDDRLLAPSDWTYAKAKELLFYLLEHGRRSHRQVGLALWPEASPIQLRRNFHNTLYHLRRALGGVDWIVHENDEYAFNRALGADDAPACRYDVEQFERLCGQAGRARSDDKRIELLQEAVALYVGDFLADLTADWIHPRRVELRLAYTTAALTLGRLLRAQGQLDAAEPVFRNLLTRDPSLEEAQRGLMRCLAERGEVGQALRQFQTFVQWLHEHHNAVPSEETVALMEQLRTEWSADMPT